MHYSRIDLLLVDVDETLVSGILAEGGGQQLHLSVVELIEDANMRGATVVLLSNHPTPADLWALTKRDRRLANSISGCIATAYPKLLTAKLLLVRLGISPTATLLLDDSASNVLEFTDYGLAATANLFAAKARIQMQPKVDPASRKRRNAIRRLALELFETTVEATLPAKTVQYLLDRKFSVHVRRCSKSDAQRIAELFARTNQLHFNPAIFSTRNLEEIETLIAEYLANDQEIYVASLNLGGMDLGIQGAAILREATDHSELINATLSCSVLPFGLVEQIFLKRVLALHGRVPVRVRIADTPYNTRVRSILLGCGVDFPSDDSVFSTIPVLTSTEEQFSAPFAAPGPVEDGVPPITTFFDTHVWPAIQEIYGGRILELGFGYGEMLGGERHRLLNSLAQKQSIELIRSDLKPSDTVVMSLDAQSMTTISDASVDAIFALELIEHVDRPAEVFREMVRVLKPGGILFLTAPDYGYPFHPFTQDRYRYSASFLRQILSLGLRVLTEEQQRIGERPVRVMFLAQRTCKTEPNTANHCFNRSRKSPLLDGLLYFEPTPDPKPRRYAFLLKPFTKQHRNDTLNAIGFLVGFVTLIITVERIHNASVTQLLSTSVSMLADRELYEQGLELLPKVQHALIDYYDDMVSRIVLAKMCQSRVSDITLSGAKLYTSHKTFAAQWSDSVLENVRFDQCTFRKLSLSNVEFDTMTSMTRCRLYDITGDHVSLRCTLRETALVDTNFTDLDAYNVVMQESKLINVDVQGRAGTFNNAVFDHVTFENVRFTRCDFQLARFVDCYFENVTFYDCNLSDALIRNVGTMGVTVDEDTIRNTVSPEARNFLRTVH